MRPRFTIRDLLWLTALVALAVGWWLDHTQMASRLDKLDLFSRAHDFRTPSIPPAASPRPLTVENAMRADTKEQRKNLRERFTQPDEQLR
jgi:hypothetical protein